MSIQRRLNLTLGSLLRLKVLIKLFPLRVIPTATPLSRNITWAEISSSCGFKHNEIFDFDKLHAEQQKTRLS